MNSLKLKLAEELLAHLEKSQGSDLKGLLDQERAPKALEVEKVSVEADPSIPMDDDDEVEVAEAPEIEIEGAGGDMEAEMSDDELAELLSKYLGK